MGKPHAKCVRERGGESSVEQISTDAADIPCESVRLSVTNSVKITLLVSETVACFLHQNRKMHPGVANNVRFIRHDVSVISNACQNLPHKFRFEQDCKQSLRDCEGVS